MAVYVHGEMQGYKKSSNQQFREPLYRTSVQGRSSIALDKGLATLNHTGLLRQVNQYGGTAMLNRRRSLTSSSQGHLNGMLLWPREGVQCI